MVRFLINVIAFGTFCPLIYLAFTFVYLQFPTIEKKWTQGIPNWISESSFQTQMDRFESFCASNEREHINLILGSSTALHGINPEILGDNWYSLASRGQNPFVTSIVLEIAQAICQQHEASIDTLVIDVYPEFCQEWVFEKADALEHLALTSELSTMLPHALQIFHGGGIRRLNSAFSYRVKHLTSPKVTQKKRNLGYEAVKPAPWKNLFPVPWKGAIAPTCLKSIKQLDSSASTTFFLSPPVLHENHTKNLQSQLNPFIASPWLDANTNSQFKDSTLFSDDHHLNDVGATLNTNWIKSNFILH